LHPEATSDACCAVADLRTLPDWTPLRGKKKRDDGFRVLLQAAFDWRFQRDLSDTLDDPLTRAEKVRGTGEI
jgi:hypothetical protein